MNGMVSFAMLLLVYTQAEPDIQIFCDYPSFNKKGICINDVLIFPLFISFKICLFFVINLLLFFIWKNRIFFPSIHF